MATVPVRVLRRNRAYRMSGWLAGWLSTYLPVYRERFLLRTWLPGLWGLAHT